MGRLPSLVNLGGGDRRLWMKAARLGPESHVGRYASSSGDRGSGCGHRYVDTWRLAFAPWGDSMARRGARSSQHVLIVKQIACSAGRLSATTEDCTGEPRGVQFPHRRLGEAGNPTAA